MRARYPLVLAAMLAVVALALAGCGSADSPGDNTPDTTPPLVAGTTPADGAAGVLTNAFITVIFNEDMAPASATGQVVLTGGGSATTTWQDLRTVVITHSSTWTEGVQVTVTLGTGLTDAAGNPLAAPYQFSFFTDTTALLLIATDPLEGATGVHRSASLGLRFSRPADLTSVADQVTIAGPGGSATYPFSVSSGGANNWVLIDPTDDLPASTAFTVTVGAAVHAIGSPSTTLGTPRVFHFTTGVVVDAAPGSRS